jgi:glycosyltransferase involved in cell wall biosynthesis
VRIAFYAPLKPPDHPTPSGDRRLARLFLAALRHAGQEPFVASTLRAYDETGGRQQEIAHDAEQACNVLLDRWHAAPQVAPDLWFTYHLYYKAPDRLGPRIAAALGIPYVVAEASCAAKRAGGVWDSGHRAVVTALRRADAVLGLNPADRDGVLPLLADPRRWIALPPFLDAPKYRPPACPRAAGGPVRLVTVAMMRPGDKLASYRLLGAALAQLGDLDWSLDVVGDGPARAEVEAALRPVGSRLRFRGACDEDGVSAALAQADLSVWPAINEAFGMALLEAQASGLPVVAGASGGVGAVVAAGETGLLTQPGDAGAFAGAVRRLIVDGAARAAMGRAAAAKVRREHDLPAAAARLTVILGRLRPGGAA